MVMQQNGLAKLLEELGELQSVLGNLAQVAGKMIQYPELQLAPGTHPDGTDLRARMVEEMGDVIGSIAFVVEKLGLGEDAVQTRGEMKLERFARWDRESPTFNLSITDKMTNPLEALADRIDVSKRPPNAATAELDETGEFVLFKSEAGHVVAGMPLKAYQSIIKHPLFRANQTEET